jgi:hypothetical protein
LAFSHTSVTTVVRELGHGEVARLLSGVVLVGSRVHLDWLER